MLTLTANGRKLEYMWYGQPSAERPTIVFLHEGLGCVSTWGDFPLLLAEATGCRALSYSRAGYGGSDPISLPWPLRFMHDEALVTLPQVLEAVGVRQSILFGHSDGASIALIHAATAKPGSVRAVIVEAPHVFVEDVTVQSIAALSDEYLAGNLKFALERHHGRNVECAFWGWKTAWLDPTFRNWNIEEYLPSIEVPVLVIQGENDEYGTTKQVEAIQRGVAGSLSKLILPNCGHTPHRSRTPDIVNSVTSFISEHKLLDS